ncbi:MAG: NADH-quinone oxidoreductase subunit L [Bacteroidetes bacterium]|nr:NADH-quinone oxidoreductase subunit L [Bacteroidota bacterium]
MNNAVLSLIIILPFLGALTIGLLGFISKAFRAQEKLIGLMATLAVAIPFGILVSVFAGYHAGGGASGSVNFVLFDWMTTANLHLHFGYMLDELSLLMGLIVTGIGALIHIYSISYMHGDSGFYKYFLYLNLFIFSMLNLILGDNLIVTFLGWEGVGACSYFLIGFWFTDMEKAKAAQKAFVANRVGDFAFLVAIFLIFFNVGSLNYADILASSSVFASNGDLAFWVALLVFIAATGKSAQIPLYVWLPDAMAGPTPVSALIHAATMVTSGIFLISRLSGAVFIHAPEVLMVVGVVGALTALMAALIAITQNDIKKVLAYSTVSQLGFMFMALGAGAFSTAIFHVMTHAFFKACLFLGSGSVIHAMDHTHAVDDPQDIRTMGGLGRFMRSTALTFWISTIAIAGIPPLAGFFSKDEILAKNFAAGYMGGETVYFFVWGVGVLTALLTAFYMTRVTTLTFNGQPRFPLEGHHPHESPALMTIPLWILAILAVVGGFLGLPEIIQHGHLNWISHHWLANESGYPVHNVHHEHLSVAIEAILIALSVIIAASGMLLSYRLYSSRNIAGDERVKRVFGKLYPVMSGKFFVDEFYNVFLIRPFVAFSRFIIMPIDKYVVDGIVNGTAGTVNILGSAFKLFQTGIIKHYALLMIMGVMGFLAYLLF